MTDQEPRPKRPKIVGWPGYYHRMSLGQPGSFLREIVTMIIVGAVGLVGVWFFVWLVRAIGSPSSP